MWNTVLLVAGISWFFSLCVASFFARTWPSAFGFSTIWKVLILSVAGAVVGVIVGVALFFFAAVAFFDPENMPKGDISLCCYLFVAVATFFFSFWLSLLGFTWKRNFITKSVAS